MSESRLGALPNPGRAARAVLLGVALVLSALLLVVASARADYEQVPEHFGVGAETGLLSNAGGIAVNVNGVGLSSGEAGSFYVLGREQILRYSPGAEGEPPQLREVWPTSGKHFDIPVGIAVDQATGDVYVFNADKVESDEQAVLEVFTATGVPVTEFGERSNLSINESPEKLHLLPYREVGIAVDKSGTIYITDRDENLASEWQSRVMIFEPEHPGDYEHYVYAGQDRDITVTEEKNRFTRVAVVGDDRLVTGSSLGIREYATTGGSTPICTFQIPGGGMTGMTANPVTGEVFYASFKDHAVHRLGPCDEATGKFEELQGSITPSPEQNVWNLAVNPTLDWGSLRAPGVLYGAAETELDRAAGNGIGDVFAPAEGSPPSILSQPTANTTATSSTLEARIDPHGFGTHYTFQYLSEEAYEANEPNERQSLAVGATGGLFGLRYGGRGLGRTASADLTAGSEVAASLATAAGTATLDAANGTANLTALTGTATATKGSATLTNVATATGAGVLSGAEGKGDLTAGSKLVEGVTTEKGHFVVGQKISGTGLPPNATIAALGAGTLELSAKAAVSGSAVALRAGSNKVTSVKAASGEFVVGQTIAAADIPPGTRITAVEPEGLTLSNIATGAGAEALSAGSLPLVVGETITGEGIPAGTTISAVGPRTLELSNVIAESNGQVTFTAGSTTLTDVTTSEGTFEVGQEVSGEGIPAGTTVKAVNGGELTLSQAAQKPGAAVAISAGSKVLTDVAVTEGSFEPGTSIAGEGIAAGTTIAAVGDESLTISKTPIKPGTGVTISSSGPVPLAVGETVEGPGIPTGTKIASLEAGKLTLSNPAESTATGAHLRIGLPFDARAGEIQSALEGLSAIGRGNVSVTGGPGDETGSTPYEIEFTGSLGNQDVPELDADASGLSGGSATAVVTTEHDGGGGFDHGATEVPAGGGELPGNGVGTASVGVSGLTPETHYRFRVVVGSECRGSGQPACEVDGDPASFATYPEATVGLPDGRAYELVSPAEKHGGEVFPAAPLLGSCPVECKPPGVDISKVFPMQSAPDGDSVAYMGQPFSSSEGAATFNSYVSARTAAGWQTTAMSPELLGVGGRNLTYSNGLGEGLVIQAAPQLSSSAPVGYANLYLQGLANPKAPRPLLTKAMFEEHEPHRGPGDLKLEYAGSSPDYSAHFFTANDSLTGETTYAPQPPDPGFSGSDLYEWRGGQLSLVNVLPGNASVATGASIASSSPDTHAVSANGRRVYWKAGGHLYVREDNRTTREVHDSGTLLAASPDGLEVLLSDGCLYSLETASCTDLTAGHGGFLGMAGTSEGLSRIYFVDTAELPGSGENDRHQAAQGGQPNLYLYQVGGGSIFIATLLRSDGPIESGGGNFGVWAAAPGARTAEASPDGRYLAFASTARLTGYDNVGLCEEVTKPGEGTNPKAEFVLVDSPCGEAFLYDSATRKLTCPSCDSTGEAPLGNSTLRRIEGANEWLPQPRYLTDSGRLFFDSGDRLSPQDANGRVEDVYEAEPDGVGSCARASGCVTLISPGSGSIDSNFLAMDQSGANVFFTTREKLVQTDTDELLDLYDAREGGGFSAETESQRAECQGESCQPVTEAPNDATPASSAFHGAGNIEEEPSRAGKKHKRKRHHRHKKHQRHGKKHKKKQHRRPAKHDRGGVK